MTQADGERRKLILTGVAAVAFGLVLIAIDFDRSTYSQVGWRQYPLNAAIGGMLVAGGCLQIVFRGLPEMVAIGLLFLSMGATGSITHFRAPNSHLLGLGTVLGLATDCTLVLVGIICLFRSVRYSRALANKSNLQEY